jgi:hypothetical protein
MIKVLVDTGAEVNLVRPDLFHHSIFQPAEKPLKLITVSGGDLEGGKHTISLVLHLHGEHQTTKKKSEHLLGGLFYEANIGWDAILSYPLLQEQKIGVLPNRECLILDQTDHFVLLHGGGQTCTNSDTSEGPWHATASSTALWVQTCSKQPQESFVHFHHFGTKLNSGSANAHHLDNPTPHGTLTTGTNWATEDYAVTPSLVEEILRQFDVGRPQVDCFATEQNKRFPQFWSTTDSQWTTPWGMSHHGLLWMNPPFS